MGDKKKPLDPVVRAPEPPSKEASPPAGAPTPAPADKASPLTGATPIDLTLTPPSLMGKEAQGPGGALGMPRLSITKTGTPAPLLGPGLDPIDWAAIRRPFTDHGQPFGDRELDEAQRNFDFSEGVARSVGLPDGIARKVANFGVPFAYKQQLAREQPGQLEKFGEESERALGPGKRLNEHILTIDSDSLSAGVKAVTGKNFSFRF
jgi:hypothetical protein